MRINNLEYNFEKIIGQAVSTGYKFNQNELHKLIKYYLGEVVYSFLKTQKYDKKYILFLKKNILNIKNEFQESILFIEIIFRIRGLK